MSEKTCKLISASREAWTFSPASGITSSCHFSGGKLSFRGTGLAQNRCVIWQWVGLSCWVLLFPIQTARGWVMCTQQEQLGRGCCSCASPKWHHWQILDSCYKHNSFQYVSDSPMFQKLRYLHPFWKEKKTTGKVDLYGIHHVPIE